jgi:predicted DNA-binding protein with PD1-like motif
MEKKFYMKVLCSSAIGALAALAYVALAGTVTPTLAAQAKLDTAKIEQLTGVKGELNEKEGVYTVRAPRTDLQVTTAGVKMNPAMGLTSYAAFMKAGAMTMVMGDTTLLEDQVNPVMSVALENDLEVTALHNHFFWDTPKVMFMHIGAGDEESSVLGGRVFAKIKRHGAKGNTAEIWIRQDLITPKH